MDRLRQRLAREESGFTLIELLVVIVIIGILLAIAVPSYLGFRGRAQDAKAKANVRAAVPSAEAYYSDNNSYTGMTLSNLLSTYDSGIDTGLTIGVASGGGSYCIQEAGQSGTTWYFKGPGGTVTSTSPGAPCS